MEKGWQNKANEYTQAKGRRKRWQKVLTVLSAIVVFCTTYALILPAITMEDTVYCGYEEKHTDECYAEVRTLVCGLAEDEGHSHTEDCYAWEKVLVCGIAETEGHAHTEACYQVKKTLTCTETDEQHVHDESCYTEEKELICGQNEVEAHHHTDSCYEDVYVQICEEVVRPAHKHSAECYETEKKLICEKQLHEHTLQCFSNPEADVEDGSVWSNLTKVELTGNWGEDLAKVAKTQAGYRESEKNYLVEEDGKTKKGYSRYGDWYGDRYGEWNGMFCAFCLNYANIGEETMPRYAESGEWLAALQKAGMYRDAGYAPKAGDLLFLKNGQMGIVTEMNAQKVQVIMGDNYDEVQYASYNRNSGQILGYGEMPENPELKAEDTPEEESKELESEEAEEPAEESEAEDNNVDEAAVEAGTEDKTEETEAIDSVEATGTAEAVDVITAEEDAEEIETIDGVEAAEGTEAVDVIAAEEGAEETETTDGAEAAEATEAVDVMAAEEGAEETETTDGVEATEAAEEVVRYCGLEEHVHTEACFDENGEAVCGLEEHIHGEACLIEPEALDAAEGTEIVDGVEAAETSEAVEVIAAEEGAEETETIDGVEAVEATEAAGKTVYYCGLEEHVHTEDCFDGNGKAVCGLEEHIHGEACLIEPETVEPVEGAEETEAIDSVEGAEASDAVEGVAAAEGTEVIDGVAAEEVEEVIYYCGLEEHTHTEECYDENGEPICGLEAHAHDETCLIAPEEAEEVIYYCGLEEHTHGEECYDENGELICGLEAHAHDETCLTAPEEVEEVVYYCGFEEHTHGEECYDENGELICGLEAHAHDETCLIAPEEVIYYCGLEEHTHTEECYDENGELICEKSVHEHVLQCRSNPEADLDEGWVNNLTGLTGKWPEDAARVAESQLGYAESVQNFFVTEAEEVKGYSRYGALYGEPYADWNAMFSAFCVEYAKVENYPIALESGEWLEELDAEEYFNASGSYLPKRGDLVFFDTDEEKDNRADRVGIVRDVVTNADGEYVQLKVVEGDVQDRVETVVYEMNDSTIMGYGALPEKLSVTAFRDGSVVTLSAVYNGKQAYNWQWQVSADQENWEDIPEATGLEYSFVALESDLENYYRIVGTPAVQRKVMTQKAAAGKNAGNDGEPLVGDAFRLGDMVGAAPMESILVVAGSDFQDRAIDQKGDYSAQINRITNIMTLIKGRYGNAYGFLSGGDFGLSSNNSEITTTGITKVKKAVQDVFGTEINMVFTQGNHDAAGCGGNATGAWDTDYYGVYAINEDDYPQNGGTESKIKSVANKLDAYLDAKVAGGYNKPVFIITHVPLHYSYRTSTSGDAKYAGYIFDVIQEHGDKLNIIFIFGHNHSGDDDPFGGSCIFLKDGDTIYVAKNGSQSEYDERKLNFTYMNYGYTGFYYSDWNNKSARSGVDNTLTMTSFVISGNDVTVCRWDEQGTHALKSPGVLRTNLGFKEVVPANTVTYSSPQTVHTGTSVQSEIVPQIFKDAATGVVVEAVGTELTVAEVTAELAEEFAAIGVANYNAYDIGVAGFTGTATVTLPAEENYNTVWYVGEDGIELLGEANEVTFADSAVTFVTDRLGVFAVGEAAVVESDSGEPAAEGDYWMQCTALSEINADGVYMITYGDHALGTTDGINLADASASAIAAERSGSVNGVSYAYFGGNGTSVDFRWKIETSGNGYKLRNLGGNDRYLRVTTYYDPKYIFDGSTVEEVRLTTQNGGTWRIQRESGQTKNTTYSVSCDSGVFCVKSNNTATADLTLYKLVEVPECSCGSTEALAAHADECARKAFAAAIADALSAEELYAAWQKLPADVQDFIVEYLGTADAEKQAALKALLGIEDEPIESLSATVDGIEFTLGGEFMEGMIPEITEIPEGDLAVLESYINDQFGYGDDRILTRAYDISVMDGEEKAEFEEPVTVTVGGFDFGTYPKFDLTATVYHFADTDEKDIAQLSGSEPVIEEIEAEIDENGSIVFETNGFSVFCFTVDFHYQDREFSIEGCDSVRLSEVFRQLGIAFDASAIDRVEFSNETFVSVEPVYADDGVTIVDWRLLSIEPFTSEEKLTVYFKDGGVLEIAVTDAQYTWTKVTSLSEGDVVILESNINPGKYLSGTTVSVDGNNQLSLVQQASALEWTVVSDNGTLYLQNSSNYYLTIYSNTAGLSTNTSRRAALTLQTAQGGSYWQVSRTVSGTAYYLNDWGEAGTSAGGYIASASQDGGSCWNAYKKTEAADDSKLYWTKVSSIDTYDHDARYLIVNHTGTSKYALTYGVSNYATAVTLTASGDYYTTPSDLTEAAMWTYSDNGGLRNVATTGRYLNLGSSNFYNTTDRKMDITYSDGAFKIKRNDANAWVNFNSNAFARTTSDPGFNVDIYKLTENSDPTPTETYYWTPVSTIDSTTADYIIVNNVKSWAIGTDGSGNLLKTNPQMTAVPGYDGYYTTDLGSEYWWRFSATGSSSTQTNVAHSGYGIRLAGQNTSPIGTATTNTLTYSDGYWNIMRSNSGNNYYLRYNQNNDTIYSSTDTNNTERRSTIIYKKVTELPPPVKTPLDMKATEGGTVGVNGEVYDNLFDDKYSTDGGTKYCVNPVNGKVVVYFTSTFGKSTKVTDYSLWTANDTATTTGGRLPDGWTLYGSDDDTTWSEIDKVTEPGMEAVNYTEFHYEVDNPTTYKYYKIEFDTDSMIQFSELQMFGEYVNNPGGGDTPGGITEKAPDHKKYIDAFRDDEDNPDTDLDDKARNGQLPNDDIYDLYRQYLDVGPESAHNNVDVLFILDSSSSMSGFTGYDATDILGKAAWRCYALDTMMNGQISSETSADSGTTWSGGEGTQPAGQHQNNLHDNGLISKITALNPNNKIAVARFSATSEELLSWTTASKAKAITYQNISGTNYVAGLQEARDFLNEVKGDGNKKIMIFLSDGLPTRYYTNLSDRPNDNPPGSGSEHEEEFNATMRVITQQFKPMFANMINSGELEIYSIGVGTGEFQTDEGLDARALLNAISTNGKTFESNNFLDILKEIDSKITGGVGHYTNLQVVDTLSPDVDFYSGQLDLKVEKIQVINGVEDYEHRLTLYENGSLTTAGEKYIQQGGVKVTPSTKTVEVDFLENYEEEGGYIYRISYNIKTTQHAYDTYATNFADATKPDGYDGVKGDKKTDYPGNVTSSEQPGFHSNASAVLKYTQSLAGETSISDTSPYNHPVIQVYTEQVDLEKVWTDGNENHTNDAINVNLYMDYVEGQSNEPIETITLNSENNWKATVANLPKNHTYSVDEISVNGYDSTVVPTQTETGWEFKIINTPITPEPPPPEVVFDHNKYIDAFRDGTDNPDTDLDNNATDKTDLYRLYLDMTGKQEPMDLLFVVDGSGSMQKTDVDNMRRDAAITKFLNGSTNQTTDSGFIPYFLGLNSENMVSVVQFYGTSTGRNDNNVSNNTFSYTGDSKVLLNWTHNSTFVNCKNNSNNDGTDYEAGLRRATEQLASSAVRNDGHKKFMIFLSDGVPTYFLIDSNDVGTECNGYTLTTSDVGHKWGTGSYTNMGNYPYCKNPSKKAFDDFKAANPNVTVFTVGVSKDIEETSQSESQSPEVLKYMATKGKGAFYSVTSSMEDLKLSLESLFYPGDVTITDNLSKYARYYGADPDVLVTMTNKDTKVTTILYQNGSVTSDGQGIVEGVTYTAADTAVAPTGSTGTVKVDFAEEYQLKPDYVYTLSFNVEATQTAYDEYAANMSADGATDGYAGIKGDADTDYPGNTTSSEKPGFKSNDSATVSYKVGDADATEKYDDPVIQASEMQIDLEKVWNDDMTEHPEITVELYRDYDPESEANTPVATVTLNDTNEWKYTVYHLAKGHAYSVIETNLPSNYDSQVSEPIPTENGWKFTITNTPKTSPSEITLDHRKYIDAFRDNEPNPDTDLDDTATDKTDLYRLYLDAGPENISKPVDVLIMVDTSTSMVGQGSGSADSYDILGGGKMYRMQAMHSLLNGLDEANNYNTSTLYANGLVSKIMSLNGANQIAMGWFNANAGTVYSWTQNPEAVNLGTATNNGYIKQGTNYMAALIQIQEMLDQVKNNGRKKIVLFVSDGEPNYYYKDWVGSNTDGLSSPGKVMNKTSATTSVPTEDEKAAIRSAIPFFQAWAAQQPNDIVFNTISIGTMDYDFMKQMVIGGTNCASLNFQTLINQMDNMITQGAGHFVNLKITDTLSVYDDFYTDNLDLLVQMVPVTNGEEGTAIPLYSGNVVNGQLSGDFTTEGAACIKSDGVTLNLNTKTVSVEFKDNYETESGYIYRLSFNVKTTQTAYDEYAASLAGGAADGYTGNKGDVDTDYPGNETSSEKPGFNSNATATLEYTHEKSDGTSVDHTEDYDDPVIQVSDMQIDLEKVWNDDMTEHPEITVELYRDYVEGGTNTPVATVTLNDTNEWKYTVYHLAKGHAYSVIETNLPSNYDSQVSEPIPTENGWKFVITNTPISKPVNLKKVDEDGNPLVGARFALYDETYVFPTSESEPGENTEAPVTNVPVATGTSDDTGVIRFEGFENFELGKKYYLKETQAPSGYIAVKGLIRFELSAETDTMSAYILTDSGEVKSPLIPAPEKVNDVWTLTITDKGIPTIKLRKVDENGIALVNAEFDLYSKYDPDNPTQNVKLNTTSLVSGSDGVIPLPEGFMPELTTYYLVETKAPDGYNLLKGPVLITFSQTGDVTAYIDADGVSTKIPVTYDSVNEIYTIEIPNSSGYELPHTGGVGTIPYYALGALLIAGALMYGCMLRRRRERGAE